MTIGAKRRVSVCTVTYNSAKDVERFLRSCEDCLDGHSLEVIVVDNASSDGTVSLVEKLSPGGRLNPAHPPRKHPRRNVSARRPAGVRPGF